MISHMWDLTLKATNEQDKPTFKTRTNHYESNLLYNILSYVSKINWDSILQLEPSWNKILLLKKNKNPAKVITTAVIKIYYL